MKSGLAELEKWIVNAKEEVLRKTFFFSCAFSNVDVELTKKYVDAECSLQVHLGMNLIISDKLLDFW